VQSSDRGGSDIHGNWIEGNGRGVVVGGDWSSLVRNNYFNNTDNGFFGASTAGLLNYEKTAGRNIVGGPFLGGNFWANPSGTGFSQTHPDADGDGICDEPFGMEDATDALPLAPWNGTPGTVPTPYRPHPVPGRVEAEDYDLGGESISYHDTTPGNTGGAYRQDGVDIETAGGVTNVGWIRTGEFLTYEVYVRDAGTFQMSVRVASPNSGRTITVSVPGETLATVAVPNTGSFSTYRTVTVPVTLSSYYHAVKLTFAGDGQNLDWIAFAKSGATPTPTPTPSVATPTPTPTPVAGGASFTAAPLSAPKGSAVKFTLAPASGKTVSAAWWSFDAPAHLNTWNSRSVNPTFFYPAAGTFSPLVKITSADGSSETVQRTNYVRVT
jgi:hypothetical protein